MATFKRFTSVTGRLIAIGAIAFSAAPAAFADPANLLANGGFERGLGDWQTYGTSAMLTTTGARSGKGAVEIQTTGGIACTVDGLKPGMTYTFSGYARSATPSEGMRFTVQNYGGQTVSAGVYSGDYTLCKVTFTAVKATADLAFWKDGGSNPAWGDDFALVEGSTPLVIPASNVLPASNAAAPPVGQDAGNLLSNGGFESGALGAWQNYGSSVSVASDSGLGGKNAAKIARTGGGIQRVSGLKPNTAYVLIGQAKVASPGESMRFTVSDYGGPDASVDIQSNDYAQQTLTFMTGASATSAKIIFWKDGGSGDAWVGGLSLKAK